MSKTIFIEDTFDPRPKQSSEINSQTIVNIENLNIHISNSYQFNSKEMNKILDYIMSKDYFKMLTTAGFSRSKKSMLREWKAHNLLYNLGYEKERTGSIDLDQNESFSRRIGYFILSLFYWR